MTRHAAVLCVLLAVSVVLSGCLDNDVSDPSAPGDDASSPDPATTTWRAAAEPAVPRGEAACETIDDRIILVGGFVEDAARVTNTVEIYDPTSDSWTRAPDLPITLHHTAVAAGETSVFVLGGYTGPGFTATNTAFQWSPGEANWTPITPLPIPRGGHGAALVDGDVWLVGGATTGNQLTAQVDIYDTDAQEWRQGPNLPTPRDHLAVDAVDGLVVAAGGRELSLSSNTGLVEVIEPGDDEWRQATPMPTARGGIGGAESPWGLAVAGGEAPEDTFEEVEAYDAANDEWTELPPLPTGRHGLCVTSTSHGLHVVTGGHDPGFAWSGTHDVLPAPDNP